MTRVKYIVAVSVVALIFAGGYLYGKFQAGQPASVLNGNKHAQPPPQKNSQPAALSSPQQPHRPHVLDLTNKEKKVRPEPEGNYLSREIPPPPEPEPEALPTEAISPQAKKQRQEMREKVAASMRREGIPEKDIQGMLDGLEATQTPLEPGYLSAMEAEMENLTPEQLAQELRATFQFDGIPPEDAEVMVQGVINHFNETKERLNADPELSPPPPPSPAPAPAPSAQ